MKDETRNFITFAVLAALILFGWPLISERLFPSAANPPVTQIAGGKTKVVPNPGADPAADGPKALRDRAVVIAGTPRVAIRTRALSGSINLKGARIDDLVLPGYKQTIEKNSAPIRLLSPSGAADAYFAGFGWSGDGLAAPGADTVWQADATTLTPDHPVTLRWTSPAGLRFAMRIAVDDRYMFTVTQTVGNAGKAPVTVRPYALVSRTGLPTEAAGNNHVGPIGVFGNGADYDVGYTNLQGQKSGIFARIFGSSAVPGPNYFDATGGWLGFGDKYWLTAIVPDQGAAVHAGFRADGDVFQADAALPDRIVAPGKALATTTRLFAGAKEVDALDGYEDKLGIRHFGKAIDWGWFEIVEKPIFTYLDWLFRHIGNFGVSIMLLTLTIRLLLFPIAQKQFKSMAAMRAIQPKMKAVQERFKDDKTRQQQEIMALYKSEGANPLAGCLPTFLQIPIFYALYRVLTLTIEMRHQPFVLWIKDLSAPDPLTPVNLFGLLPFVPPHFIAIGVVPIILGITMYFQFKANPTPMDDAQKQVFALMPWVLMFVMAPFAVGLQVYWITSNCLTILQQRLLAARHPAPVVLAK